MGLNRHSFDDEKPRKKKYNNYEKKLAKKVGGRRQPNSGAITGFKGDVITQEFLLDLKTTKHMSATVKVEELQKITNEALPYNKVGALVIHFENVDDVHVPSQWVCMPLDEFNIIQDKLNEKES